MSKGDIPVSTKMSASLDPIACHGGNDTVTDFADGDKSVTNAI